MKYIEVGKAAEIIAERLHMNIADLVDILGDVPAEKDVVKIVRCKDCKYSEGHGDMWLCTIDEPYETYYRKDYFCANGELPE